MNVRAHMLSKATMIFSYTPESLTDRQVINKNNNSSLNNTYNILGLQLTQSTGIAASDIESSLTFCLYYMTNKGIKLF